jgi:hypothetical protein
MTKIFYDAEASGNDSGGTDKFCFPPMPISRLCWSAVFLSVPKSVPLYRGNRYFQRNGTGGNASTPAGR